MASPKPVPPSRDPPWVNRSNTRDLSCGAMPGPVSATSNSSASFSVRANTDTCPPGGLCREALSSRLATT
ncbi:Uncharacterised protein [Mycobacteroides abscessus subsp. abscessus]|nr:Uncharacterised protein [Mycobacteroides abscessus subsp. abscessus]